MAQNPLDQLCDDIAGCETLAFFDLSTRTVLLKNTSSTETQDTLNALCGTAALMLEDGATGMVATPEGLTVFLRSASMPSDVLCCVCATDTDIDHVLAAGQTCLDELGGTA